MGELDENAFEWYYLKVLIFKMIQKEKGEFILWTTVVVPRQE